MKLAHFLLVRTNYNLNKLTELYVKEIVRFHGAPVSIVLDQDLRFTLRFLPSLQEVLGTKLKFSIAFHPKTEDTGQ